MFVQAVSILYTRDTSGRGRSVHFGGLGKKRVERDESIAL